MNIMSKYNHAVVSVSRDELDRYGVEFENMSLSDRPTRVMIGDMLRMLGHMGVIGTDTHGGQNRDEITIECAQSESGGCVMLFRRDEAEAARGDNVVIFSDINALCDAALAGALTKGDRVRRLSRGRYIAEIAADAAPERLWLLREFSE